MQLSFERRMTRSLRVVLATTLVVDSDLQEQGQDVDVAFPTPGLFEVRCGVHPRMHMTVNVTARP